MADMLIDGDLRLRPGSMEDVAIAVAWYSDTEVLKFSEGITKPYSRNKVRDMYKYLMNSGHFYIIEILRGGEWKPVGDACLMDDSVPIVIGVQEYRSKGYGKRALALLIELAGKLEWRTVRIKGVYSYNERSMRLFTSLGFRKTGEHLNSDGITEVSFALDLAAGRGRAKKL